MFSSAGPESARKAASPISQAMRLKTLEKEGRLTEDAIFEVMEEEKGNQKEVLRIQKERLAKYFPRNITDRQMESMILKIIEDYFLKRKREQRQKQGAER